MEQKGYIYRLIILLLSCQLVVFVLCSSNNQRYKDGDSLLKPGFMLVSVDHTRMLTAFMDNETYKIGFARNQSDITVAIPPMYDNAYNSGYLLYPVMLNGKWGVMDLGGRFYSNDGKQNFRTPVIPCKYNTVKVIDDFVVICDGKKIDVRELGFEMY